MGAIQYGPKQANVRAYPQNVSSATGWVFGGARLAIGFYFLWAFLDKMFGFGYSTKPTAAWLNGGSPTKGYLGSSVGPFADVFKSMAGHPVVNALFMVGLLAIGTALILGVGMRIAVGSGILMVSFMYLSHVPWAVTNSPNPIFDAHVIDAALLAVLAVVGAGKHLGLGQWWSSTALVRRFPALE